MKRIICGILVISMCFLLIACGTSDLKNQREAEGAALNYIQEYYCPTSGCEVSSVEKNGSTNYTISYDVNQDYAFWKIIGSMKFSVYKNAGEWAVDVIEDNTEYIFENNDNWYYIATSSNREYLIKMIGLSKNQVTMEYYRYSLGNYGEPSDYDHEITNVDLEYDGANYCFTFAFMGDWRINSNAIKYNQYEVGAYYEYYQSGDFETIRPVDPNDYWWFEKAVNATDKETPTTSDSQIENVEISGGDVSGEIQSEQHEICYTYVAKTEGVHCVQFTSDDETANFYYELSTTNRLDREEYEFAKENMASVYLDEGETLKVTVLYGGHLCKYQLCVIEPNPVEKITGTSFEGRILFASQENKYTYVAPKTGIYSFALGIDHGDKNYTIEIADTNGKLVANTTYSQAAAKAHETNLLAPLEEGTTYIISIKYKYEFPQYSITITEPKPTRTISEIAIEDRFEFWEQEDSFTYTPTQSGNATFSFAIDQTTGDYNIEIANSNGTILYNGRFNSLSYGKQKATIMLELKAGETYTITICQNVSLCGYSVAANPS